MSDIAIGFNGVAQAGKDTSGEHLVERYGFVRVSFADPVREAYYKLNPVIPVQEEQAEELGLFEHGVDSVIAVDRTTGTFFFRLQFIVDSIGWDKAKQISEIRVGLQRTGTECGREIHGEDCWLNIAKRKVGNNRRVVFTDVRFDNEVEFVRNLGFDKTRIYQIIRPNYGSVNEHKSDTLLPSEIIDEQLYNDSTERELCEKLDNIIRNI